MGPTALAALLTFQAAGGVWQRAVLLSFLTGIIEILMGVLQLGFIIDFVSGPVGSGFTSAAAMIILSSQVKDLLGMQSCILSSFMQTKSFSFTFFAVVYKYTWLTCIHTIEWGRNVFEIITKNNF